MPAKTLKMWLRYGFTLLMVLHESSLAPTLPDDWRDYVDVEMATADNDQSRYSSELFEGDILGLDFDDIQGQAAANAVDDSNLLWPNNTVPYEFTTQRSAAFRASEKKMIEEAMAIIMHLTGNCVNFVARTNETDFVKFQKSFQCSSNIGRIGQKQLIQLTSGCILHYGCIQHELMHTLGFYHEQSRLDRDDYVFINWNNIATEDKIQFEKRTGETYGLPYDYQSIMHYEMKAFAKDSNLPTVIPKVKGMKMGQNENLSPLDVARIHRRFKCNVPTGKQFAYARNACLSSTPTSSPASGNDIIDKDAKQTAIERPKSDVNCSASLQRMEQPQQCPLHCSSMRNSAARTGNHNLASEPFPQFSNWPMSPTQCALQFTPNCHALDYTNLTCTNAFTLDINCNLLETSFDIQRMTAAMSVPPLRAIRLMRSDGTLLAFSNYAAIRKQIIIFSLADCKSSRVTLKLLELQFINLLAFGLIRCYDLAIEAADFGLTNRLRQITIESSTISTLEKYTFTDLPALRLISLEYRMSRMDVFSERIREYLKKLHCSGDFQWFREWWDGNEEMLRKSDRGGVLSIGGWDNLPASEEEVNLPIDCDTNKFPTGWATTEYTQFTSTSTDTIIDFDDLLKA
ncbi:uncharacterized protein LOC129601790 [Paramacrobiotus metropolitanus]|uniref:uncharacterized protein LOC129601790 n=1 Tax=Paramacrobiotus metropolitanus TaxID=2943436 RepID=UPI0024462BDA|nr:uncharacterized protein LOC129601790 [Paramacrobiotus metropolitanus]